MEHNKSLNDDNEDFTECLYQDVSKGEMRVSFSKLTEDKQVFVYKKLVVPMSMRSIYWKYFGFPASDGNDILTKVKIVCTLCKTQIAYNRNTSNLRMHLQNKHPAELAALELKKPLKSDIKDKKTGKKLKKNVVKNLHQHIYSTSADGIVQVSNDLQFIAESQSIDNLSQNDIDDVGKNDLKSERASVAAALEAAAAAINSKSENQISLVLADDNMDMKSVADLIIDFLIMDLQLPEMIEGQGFLHLLGSLKTPCEIPNKTRLEQKIIPRIYLTYKDNLSQIIADLNSEYSLIFEEWKSNNEEYFTTISICYQNSPHDNLNIKILNTIHTPFDWDENQWGNAIDNVVLEWNLNTDKIVAFVVANDRQVLMNAIYHRNYRYIPCLLHLIQHCAVMCFENQIISNILNKCRSMIGVFMANSTLLENLNAQESLNELEENVLILDYPSIWVTTYNMLEAMLFRKEIIKSLISSIDGIDQHNIELTDEQWEILDELVTLLESFKVITITLSEEKLPLLSLLKPLLWQLLSSHLTFKDCDSELIKLLKKQLSEILTDRFEDQNINMLLNITTFLDPRFKQLPYISADEKQETANIIKDKVKKLIMEETSETQIKIERIPPSKKSRLSGMEQLLGGICTQKNTPPAEQKAELELVQYQSEPVPPLSCCPFEWWDKLSAKCPYMSKAFRGYNCVPICSIPPSRITSEAQIIFNTRRSSLPPHLADKLLFLHGNYSYSS